MSSFYPPPTHPSSRIPTHLHALRSIEPQYHLVIYDRHDKTRHRRRALSSRALRRGKSVIIVSQSPFVVKTYIVAIRGSEEEEKLTAPHLEQVFEPESMAAEHLGQEEWLKLTGCILGDLFCFRRWLGSKSCFDGRIWVTWGGESLEAGSSALYGRSDHKGLVAMDVVLERGTSRRVGSRSFGR